jgi:hypothetical protein
MAVPLTPEDAVLDDEGEAGAINIQSSPDNEYPK